MKGNDFAKIAGAILVGGLWLVALADYLRAPSGANQGAEVAGSSLIDFYSVLEGNGAPLNLPQISGVAG